MDHRLAPAGSGSWLGLSIGAPPLNTTRFSQQKVFEDKTIFAIGKRSATDAARHLAKNSLRSSFDFDDFVKRLAIRAREAIERRWSAASHDTLPYPIRALLNSTLHPQARNVMRMSRSAAKLLCTRKPF